IEAVGDFGQLRVLNFQSHRVAQTPHLLFGQFRHTSLPWLARGLRVGTHLRPWFCEAKQALTVDVRAPLSTHRDWPPSLAHVACPGNEARYGPVGESIGWGEAPNRSRGDTPNSWEARARLWHDVHISWPPVRRWRGVVPALLKVDSNHHASADSGTNGDALP